MSLLDDGGGVAHELGAGALAGALGGEGEHGDLRVDAEDLGGAGSLDGDLGHLLGGGQDDVAVLVLLVLVGDVDGAVAHGDHLIAAGEDEAGGDEVCAFLGLDELQGGTHGVGGGVGGAAEQGVGQTLFHQHGAEVVGLHEHGAGVLGRGLALAQRDEVVDELVHVGIGRGVEDLQTLDVEAALGGCCLDLIDIADEHGGEEAVLLQARGGLEDAGVGALGVDDLAGIGFENFYEIFKHG